VLPVEFLQPGKNFLGLPMGARAHDGVELFFPGGHIDQVGHGVDWSGAPRRLASVLNLQARRTGPCA